MKITFVNSSLTGGGSERVMSMIANYFADLNYDTSMILIRDGKQKSYEVSEKLKCIQFNYKFKNKIFIFFSRLRQLRKYLNKYNPDIIISFMWDINLFTLISSIGLHKKIIISERSFPGLKYKNFLKTFVRWFGQKYIYLLADKIVLQTNDVKEYYTKRVQKKCVVIPNPINPNLPKKFTGIRKKVIVAVGRLTFAKNFAMLINSFSKFHYEFPEYKLIIYGEGELLSRLCEQVKTLNLENYVEFPGYIKDVNNKMLDASIYVSCSNYEGISNSMMESLAMGIPSICTDCPVGGARMVIKNNENGILIPVGDTEKLYKSMKKIVENPDFSSMISKNAENVKQQYSINVIANMWLKIMK